MEPLASLPLPAGELPEAIRRFGNPDAPAPARTMAARGLLPVKGNDLVALLAQLSADVDAAIAETARKTVAGLPREVLHAACSGHLHPALLDRVADLVTGDDDALERLVANQAAHDDTILRVARSASERVGESIAVNQQRLLGAPLIIEALYKNKNVLMSTADRLVDLAVRNHVVLAGIPGFKDHADALMGELIPEPEPGEVLPSDLEFKQAIAHDADDPDAVVQDPAGGDETVTNKFVPLQQRIGKMSIKEKLRLALVGDRAARALLVRDNNRAVAHAAISSPLMTEDEAVPIARSREVGEDILRTIAGRRQWLRNYELKRALVFNPKLPVGLAIQFIPHLHQSDLRELSRSRNVSPSIKSAALQRIASKEKS